MDNERAVAIPATMTGAELHTWLATMCMNAREASDVLETSEDTVELWINDIEPIPGHVIETLMRYENGLHLTARRIATGLAAPGRRPVLILRWKTQRDMDDDPQAPKIPLGAHIHMVALMRAILIQQEITSVVRWKIVDESSRRQALQDVRTDDEDSATASGNPTETRPAPPTP